MEIDGKKVEGIFEIREIYDGWSIAKLEDGTLYNRWPVGDRRHKPAQEWIDKMLAERTPPTTAGREGEDGR